MAAHCVERTETGPYFADSSDGGPTEHGLESTIVAVEGTRLRVLRAGPVTAEEDLAAGCGANGARRRARFRTRAEVKQIVRATLACPFSSPLEWGTPGRRSKAPGQMKKPLRARRTRTILMGAGVPYSL